MIKVTIDGEIKEYGEGTTFEDIANDYQRRYDDCIALVKANGKLTELRKVLDGDVCVEFVLISEEMGYKTYERTATMLMLKAITDVIGDRIEARSKVEFKVGNGVFIDPLGGYEVSAELADRVRERMKELTDKNIPIDKKTYPVNEALEIFREQGMEDKIKLFKYRRSSVINVYSIDGYYDYFYGYMLPSTGYVKWFDIEAYDNGFMLLLPPMSRPKEVDSFDSKDKLFATLCAGNKWGKHLDIDTVGDLNNAICAGNMDDVILIQEALQERRIGEIATQIAARPDVKFVMIAGPSSSGKTSFSHRLSIQLKTHGLTPHPVACDNYFKNRDDTPRLPNGDYDFECLEAIDVELFNSDMSSLLKGEEVELPSFNFKTGQREYNGDRLKLNSGDILVIEGIHGLNDRMSHSLPSESKFKIYISALTTINVDEHNRIPTTDGRLIRRLVRDYRTRGASAKRTLQMWANVRRGEEQNIFPYQESADVMFNSALIYELAALKPYAEPLLYSVEPGEPEYYEAKRLLKFMEYFLSIPSDRLPNNSIAREFVGGSCFNV